MYRTQLQFWLSASSEPVHEDVNCYSHPLVVSGWDMLLPLCHVFPSIGLDNLGFCLL